MPANLADPDPGFVDQIPNVVQPRLGYDVDAIVARPVQLDPRRRRLGGIHIDAFHAAVDVNAAIWALAGPGGEQYGLFAEGRSRIGARIQRHADTCLRRVPKPTFRRVL